jgi:hypothetical protein
VYEYHSNVTNLRTQFRRILKKADVEAWTRIFHNLSASRQTELQEVLPDHASNQWLGISSRVAEEHYITVHDEHWDRALNFSPTCPPIDVRTGPIDAHQEIEKTNDLIGDDGVWEGGQYPRPGAIPNEDST